MISKFTHSEKQIIGAFVALKLLIHFLTNTIYTFHRDEFLYLDEGNHLSWGYLEVPPLTPFLGKVVTSIFGDSVFSVRLLPALTGVIVLVLVTRLVKELGGGKLALILACTAFLTSLAFLRTSTLFQPVGLDVLWWVLLALLAVLILKYNHRRDYYLLGLVIGLGWLTKYSIAFMVVALLAGVFLTPQRRELSLKGLLIAGVIALSIVSPNLYWQYAHNFPVVTHLRELASTQLVHVEPSGFLVNQLLMHFSSALIWIPGVLWLLFAQRAKPYRYLGWTYVLIVGMILLLHGKDYYTLGAYPVMMAAGGVAVAEWLKDKSAVLRYTLLALVVIPNLLLLPMGVPLLPVKRLISYCAVLSDLGFEQRWEDGHVYPIPQDYADMQAWEEIPAMVSKKYHSLARPLRDSCLIYGGNYAHAGVLNHYRKKYDLPEAFSLHASYVLWIPDSIQMTNMILVDNVWSDTTPLFFHQEFVDSIRYPYTRDPGFVFYRSQPRPGMDTTVKKIIREAKAPFYK